MFSSLIAGLKSVKRNNELQKQFSKSNPEYLKMLACTTQKELDEVYLSYKSPLISDTMTWIDKSILMVGLEDTPFSNRTY